MLKVVVVVVAVVVVVVVVIVIVIVIPLLASSVVQLILSAAAALLLLNPFPGISHFLMSRASDVGIAPILVFVLSASSGAKPSATAPCDRWIDVSKSECSSGSGSDSTKNSGEF